MESGRAQAVRKHSTKSQTVKQSSASERDGQATVRGKADLRRTSTEEAGKHGLTGDDSVRGVATLASQHSGRRSDEAEEREARRGWRMEYEEVRLKNWRSYE